METFGATRLPLYMINGGRQFTVPITCPVQSISLTTFTDSSSLKLKIALDTLLSSCSLIGWPVKCFHTRFCATFSNCPECPLLGLQASLNILPAGLSLLKQLKQLGVGKQLDALCTTTLVRLLLSLVRVELGSQC